MSMPELKNTLENKILMQLKKHQAIGENKLLSLVSPDDSTESRSEYQDAISILWRKGLIDVVKDPTETMQVVRMRVTYQ